MNTQVETLFNTALQHHSSGSLAAAEKSYRQALQLSPDHFDAAHLLGVVLHQMGRRDDSLRALARSLEIKPDYMPALKDQGLIQLRMGQNAAALDSFRKALAVSPETAEFHLNCGIALKNLGRIGEAISCYEAAIRLNPRLPEAYNNLGNALALQGEPERALASFERAIALRNDYVDAIFSLGTAQFGLERYEEAIRNFVQVLKRKPDHPDASYNLCFSLMRQARYSDALAVVERALRRSPQDPRLHKARGLIHLETKQHKLAREDFDRVLAVEPKDPESLLLRADANYALKSYGEALSDYERVIALTPGEVQAYRGRSRALRKLKRLDEALSSCDSAIALKPDFGEAYRVRGIILLGKERLEEALADFEQAISLRPDSAEAHNGRGQVLVAMERFDEGLSAYDQAIALKPNYAEAHLNRGRVLLLIVRFDEALASFERAISLSPDDFDARLFRGVALLSLHQKEEALRALREAINLNSEAAEGYVVLGSALASLRRYKTAVACYDRAIALRPELAEAHERRGSALEQLRRPDEALESLETALALKPTIGDAIGKLWRMARHTCRWDVSSRAEAEVRRRVESGKEACDPFTSSRMFDDPRLQRDVSQFCTRFLRHAYRRSASRRAGQSEKIRVAYFSSDFHEDHPVAKCMRPVIENHNRSRFDVLGITFGAANRSELDYAIIDRLAGHHHVENMRTDEVVALAAELKIDIAVDVNGHTLFSRTDLFAAGVAPLQVGFLGFPGTMGEGLLDYIIGDRTVIPETSQESFFEKVAYLPDCYLPYGDFDGKVKPATSTRSSFGIRDDAFVFCCFNSVDKIGPETFELWMSVMAAVENSVLWLRSDSETANANLRREAEKRNISGNRLLFAAKESKEVHVERHRLSDLFLDTLPYNAHSTAWDALSAGLPLLTLTGRSFAGRVATSVLNATGFPELVTQTGAEYVDRAIALARDPQGLGHLRSRLEGVRQRGELFDAARFTRNLEAAYERMIEAHVAGRRPDHISITPD